MERSPLFLVGIASFLLFIGLFIGGCSGSARVNQQVEPPPAPPPPPVAGPATTPAPTLEMPGSDLPPAKQAIKHVLERFGRMWEDESMKTFAEVIAHDPNIVVIGTDSAEYIVGYETYRRVRKEQFGSFENIEFYVENQRIRLSESGEVAWFTEQFDLFTVAQGQPVRLNNLRLSGILQKRDGQWRIVQLHTSMPVAGQAAEY